MAVAVAIMAVQAMAMAPVILDIPSPVVGNAENVTPANGFVYPDAIDLTKYVTDQESQSSQIIWSYEIIGTPKYSINGKVSMVTPGDNPVSPGATQTLNTVAAGEADFDSNPLTITVRNINLSPIPGQAGTDPGTPGILTGETQAVTLYASDQTTYSAKSVWFYTDDGGHDRLSPGNIQYQFPGDHANTSGWNYALLGGAVSQSNGTGMQFCFTTTASTSATDDKLATWQSPYSGDPALSTMELVANSAYKIRMVINGSQTDVTKVPYWDMTVNNDGGEGHAPIASDFSNYRGRNGFGGNFFFLSNTGGANAAIQQTGGKPFIFWWCPSPVSTARWNDTTETQTGYFGGPGPYAPSMVTNRNAFVEFRVLQTASNAGANQIGPFGTLCLTDLTVERFDMSTMQVVTANLYNATTITSTNTNADGGTGTNYTASFSGGTLTLTPTTAGSGPTGTFLAQVGSGTSPAFSFSPETAQDHANYPCTMDPQSLYLVSMDLSAPTQSDMDHPPAQFWLGADCPTNELICLAWVTPVNFNHHAGPTLTPSTFKAFFYSNYASTPGAGFEWVSIFRPRFMLTNNGNLGRGEDSQGALNKSGAIRIHNMKVDKVMFPGG